MHNISVPYEVLAEDFCKKKKKKIHYCLVFKGVFTQHCLQLKMEILFKHFGCLFTQQQRFWGLKMQIFENT